MVGRSSADKTSSPTRWTSRSTPLWAGFRTGMTWTCCGRLVHNISLSIPVCMTRLTPSMIFRRLMAELGVRRAATLDNYDVIYTRSLTRLVPLADSMPSRQIVGRGALALGTLAAGRRVDFFGPLGSHAGALRNTVGAVGLQRLGRVHRLRPESGGGPRDWGCTPPSGRFMPLAAASTALPPVLGRADRTGAGRPRCRTLARRRPC